MSSQTTDAVPERDSREHQDTENLHVPSDEQVSAQDIDAEPPSETQAITGAKYSIFTTTEKRSIVFLAAFGAFFSPLSAQIYYPALDALSRDLHVSITEVNLTVTTYMVRNRIVNPPLLLMTEKLTARRSFKESRPCSWVRWRTRLDGARPSSSVSSYTSPPASGVPWPLTTPPSSFSELCSPPAPAPPCLCARPSCQTSLPRPSAAPTSPSPLSPSSWRPRSGPSSAAFYPSTWVGAGSSGS